MTTQNDDEKFASFMRSAKADAYFGRGFLIKCAVLQHLTVGTPSLGEIARQHGVSRPAVSRYARRAREFFR